MTRSFPSGDLRASDAERDAALAELSEHFQSGRLTQDEFDDRSGRALAARTGNDLRELFTDLPDPGAPSGLASPSAEAEAEADPGAPEAEPGPESAVVPPAPAPVARGGQWSAGRIVIGGVIAAIILGNVSVNVGHHAVNHSSYGWIVPVVILLIIFRRLGR